MYGYQTITYQTIYLDFCQKQFDNEMTQGSSIF